MQCATDLMVWRCWDFAPRTRQPWTALDGSRLLSMLAAAEPTMAALDLRILSKSERANLAWLPDRSPYYTAVTPTNAWKSRCRSKSSVAMSESLNNCSSEPDGVSWGSCTCPTLEADPDIAGIGVISSFITSSCLAIISTCLYLALIRSGLVPDGSFEPVDRRVRNRDGIAPDESFNPIDSWARRCICTRFVRFILRAQWIDSRIDKIRGTLFSFVLSLADMQLVTGIAMLSAAVIKLHRTVGEWWIDKARHLIVDYQGLAEPDRHQRMRPWRKVFAWFWYIISSETIAVVVDGYFWFALGLYWTFEDRNSVHRWLEDSTDIGKENDLEGFGQLVPILLLGVPFLQVLEMYCGSKSSRKRTALDVRFAGIRGELREGNSEKGGGNPIRNAGESIPSS
ncbi:hypothetical protein DL769_009750 [Monosporascus sp. CRB-8-3]|nr:hypothetical protein DL769_009750 [Monosporascus sp. CRB-8-3]